MQTLIDIAQIACVALVCAVVIGMPLFLLALGFGKLLFNMTREDGK